MFVIEQLSDCSHFTSIIIKPRPQVKESEAFLENIIISSENIHMERDRTRRWHELRWYLYGRTYTNKILPVQ